MRPSFPLRSLVIMLVSALPLMGDDDEDDKKKLVDELGFSRAPYVQLATPNSIHILWRTVDSIDPIVRYGLKIDELTGRIDEEHILKRRVADSDKDLEESREPLHSGPEDTRQFEAEITGLQPGKRYYYAIYDDDERLTPEDESYHFHTQPDPNAEPDAYFWVVGDSGTGKERQSEVHESMLKYTEEQGRPIDFYLHVGDMAYTKGTDDQFQRKFFKMYEETLRHTVVWPAMGNHEGDASDGAKGIGPYYDAYHCPTKGEAGGVASGHESYYSFDHGRIHFIVLNSFDVDRAASGAMAGWLKEDLSRTQADWLIAYWHHPPYTKGTHDSDKESKLIEMREIFMPILESHGVDLVLTGHSHIYERSMLMDGAYSTPTTADGVILDDGDGDPESDGAYRKLPGLEPNQGAVQVVAGHGGTGVGRKGTMPVMKRIIVENGSVLVSIKDNVLDGVMINYKGEERDHFQLRKEAGVVAKRVESPLTLPPFVKPGEKLPRDAIDVLPEESEWAYYLSEGEPPLGWMRSSYDDTAWSRGTAGFGYGDDDDKTVLPEIAQSGDRLYVRTTFEVLQEMDKGQLGLGIRYDDAFIVYVNGEEVLRQGVGSGRGASASDIGDHEAEKDFEYFPLDKAEQWLREGTNVIAIECHSIDSDEGDFTLDPFLVEELDSDRAGGEALPIAAIPYRPEDDTWRYSLEQDYDSGWEAADFDDSAWEEGEVPMGYGKRLRVRTSLKDMKDEKTRVRLRKALALSASEWEEPLGLVVTWDDGFIAYINGHEMGRAGVARGAGKEALGFGHTGSPVSRYFPFAKVKEHLRDGRNVIAIEGHNREKGSSDYYMAPTLEKAWPVTWKRIPRDYERIIKRNAKWEFLTDDDPKPGWTTGKGWERDRAPFGYGMNNLETKLKKMRGRYSRVYLRRQFELKDEADFDGLGIFVAWDDAVIGYLNGKEILRIGVESGRGAEAEGLYSVGGPATYVHVPLEPYRELLRVGDNHLAFEGHNRSRDSSDFVLSPVLIRVDPATAQQRVLPKDYVAVVPPHAVWRYCEETPEGQWASLGYDDSRWQEGEAGFGYADEDDRTELHMEGHFTTLYLRKTFEIANAEDFERLGMALRWDDGFIAYLNGHEIMRHNVKEGRGEEAKGIRSSEAEKDPVAFRLEPYSQHLKVGPNVLAIEGHNKDLESSDFTLDPFIFLADWDE